MGKKVKSLSRTARQKLLAHRWPGNVRELRNVIERALILETSREVQPASLPDFQLESRLHKDDQAALAGDKPLDEIVADFERNLIHSILERHGHSLNKAADSLRLSRHALRYRMQRLNIAMSDDDEASEPDKEGDRHG